MQYTRNSGVFRTLRLHGETGKGGYGLARSHNRFRSSLAARSLSRHDGLIPEISPNSQPHYLVYRPFAHVHKNFFSSDTKDPKVPVTWWNQNRSEKKPESDSKKTNIEANSEKNNEELGRPATSLLNRKPRQRIPFGSPNANDNKHIPASFASAQEFEEEDEFENENENDDDTPVDDAPVPSDIQTLDNQYLNNQINQIRTEYVPYLPELLLVPHNTRPTFPGLNEVGMYKFDIAQQTLLEALKEAKSSDRPYVGLFKEKALDIAEQNAPISPPLSKDSFHDIGVLAEIIDIKTEEELKNYKVINIDMSNGAPSLKQSPETQTLDKPVNDGYSVFLRAHRRLELNDILDVGPPTVAKVTHVDEPDRKKYNESRLKAYANEIEQTIRDIIRMNPMLSEHHQPMIQRRLDIKNWPGGIADFAASLSNAENEELQEVLSAVDLEKRLELVLVLLKKELTSGKVQNDINRKVDEKIGANQRKYVLMERLKEIKKELGMDNDEKETYMSKFRQRVIELNEVGEGIPKEAQLVIDEEMTKLENLEKNSADFNMSRSYLEWLTCLPWSYFSNDSFDLKAANEILERDHYGLADVKERILEFIAVGKLRGSVQGKILLLVGPPGVGKTSIGKSIAESLDRKFYRFSVGGLSDVSEIKGHRRTYVGAMPGKMIQCLKITNVSNPLVLIDEIDKLGSGIRGDPASALLELLDPSQNTAFMDHYLDVPFDASKVLFVCTANTTDTIPGPLLDRMEVIRLSGYDLPEKVAIAQQYLEPRAKADCGLIVKDECETPAEKEEDVESKSQDKSELDGELEVQNIPKSLSLDSKAVEALARWYCREAGVRKLEQHIERIYRKLALKVLRAEKEELEDEDAWIIKEKQLQEYVGKPTFTSDRLFDEPPPGVVMGLAWTSYGGSALYIESTNLKRPAVNDESAKNGQKVSGGFFVTGQLGDVMKESTQIALTHSKHKLQEIDPMNNFFETNQIHMHTPEGATPKDGPSAGVTMTTALLSLALNKPVVKDLAMTGELSLVGMVLPVGGIKEKVIAARRSGVKTIVLPFDNQKDVDELADYLKEDVTFHFAKTYDDVFKVAFA